MAYNADHLQALEDALASGERLVRFDNRWIEYRSVDELRAAIAEVKRSQAAASGKCRARQVRVITSKGF